MSRLIDTGVRGSADRPRLRILGWRGLWTTTLCRQLRGRNACSPATLTAVSN
jgi:hypothetical protein